ncbi:hypothetical protein LUZ60_006014 [Juncus effusus]|nr:hypothetical protein LUZ60_006014 [Juncus effusus]
MQGQNHQLWSAPVAAGAAPAAPTDDGGAVPPAVDAGGGEDAVDRRSAVVSVKIIRNKLTGLPDGYGFIEFISHEAAERILLNYNGLQMMPNTEHPFRLNWASFSSGDKRSEVMQDHSIFVRDLAPDVTDFILQETFRVNYPSVRGAKVVIDVATGRSKGYGFVKFADEAEKNRAMAEMNGMFCSTRQMRISKAIPKRPTPVTQGAGTLPPVASDPDGTNTTIYIENLDPNITEDELRIICSHIGEINYVKIPLNKECDFVQFSHRSLHVTYEDNPFPRLYKEALCDFRGVMFLPASSLKEYFCLACCFLSKFFMSL